MALIGSICFYTWGAPKFILIVLISLIVDFYMVQLFNSSEGRLRKRLLWATIFSNVVILLVSKYLNFFVGNVNSILGMLKIGGIAWKDIILPIGVSFITFQKISYVVDCYRDKVKPLEKLQDYMLYILFFPQLIAGPIVRFNEVASQLIDREAQENIEYRLSGLFRFIIGLSKKVLIANVMGEVVDKIFQLPVESLHSGYAWLGIIAYSFQIYFDFSGYSDMAIGIAKMLGFRFPENFNYPYISQSITEFWRRWHITLGNWMRDYLYIPLGGNRVSTNRLYINLWTVFLISGLWHGAAWTFIIWGAFHGLFLILDRLFLLKILKKIGNIPAVFLTYFIVLIGWVFFRSDGLGNAIHYIYRMFAFDFSTPGVFIQNKFYVIFILATCCSFLGIFKWIEDNAILWYEKINTNLFVLSLKCMTTVFLGWLCIIEIFGSNFNPFIYFRF